MTRKDPRAQVLRLRKKHAAGLHDKPTAEDGARLVAAQSVRHALLAGLIATIVFAILWSLVTQAFGRFFPWMTLVLGFMVGYAVRRGGQGFDWRFPLVAVLVTLAGALLGIVVVSAGTTAADLGTTTFKVLRNVTTLTWPVFFEEVIDAADLVYALLAAMIAGPLALRRLNRREFQAVRLWQAQQGAGQKA